MSSFLSFGQELVNSIPLELKKEKDAFQIVNEAKKQTSLFLSDKTSVKAIRLDEKMQVLDSISTARPGKEYDLMIGYNINASSPRLFWSSSDHKKIGSQFFDFEKHAVVIENYDFKFDNERFLEVFSAQNTFYMVTIVKKTSTLKFYVFDNSGKLGIKTVDVTGRFFDENFKPTTLYGIFDQNLYPFEDAFKLEKITSESPTSLTESAKKRKAYFSENQLILSFDTNKNYTQLITVDLTTFMTSEKVYNMPYIMPTEFTYVSSNSFLKDDLLYQMKVTTEKMIVSIKNRNGDVLKEYSVNGDELIKFKNSEIVQENGGVEKTRILEKTSQFLRKTSNQNPGISVVATRNGNLVTLGSVSAVRDSSGATPFAMFGAAGVLMYYAISNPTYDSFNSYKNRKVVSINCLFDQNGNHVSGEVQPVAFDTIRTFLESYPNATSQTLFKLDHFYYLGFYNKTLKTYELRKFTE